MGTGLQPNQNFDQQGGVRIFDSKINHDNDAMFEDDLDPNR